MYYHTLNEELRRRFGCKVYKLALDGGFTCPQEQRCKERVKPSFEVIVRLSEG